MKIYAILLITLMLASVYRTANAVDFEIAPMFTASAEYQIDEWSSEFMQVGCTTHVADNSRGTLEVCSGDNPRAEFKYGFEFAFGDWREHWYIPVFQAGGKHRSNWVSGPPFNGDDEHHSESFFIELKLGGLR